MSMIRLAAWIVMMLCLTTASARAEARSDSLARAEAPPDSLAGIPGSIRVLLDDGTEVGAKRVRIGSLGSLRLVLENGRDSVLTASRVRRIEDEKGRDRTHEVLVDEKSIRVGGPAPRKRDNPPPNVARWLVSAHASAANPAGNFRHFAANGYAVDGGIERRTRRHASYGLRIDFADFGGDEGFEELLARTYPGGPDQLQYRFLGVSLFSRYFILPDRRVNPFLLATLGVGNLRVSLSGPAEEGKSSGFSTTGEAGLGLAIRLGERLDAEFLGSYGGTGSGQRYLRTDSVSLSVEGDTQYIRFTAGLVRRFGPSR